MVSLLSASVCFILAVSCSVVLSANVATTSASKVSSSSETPTAHTVLDKLPILELLKNPKVVNGYTGCLLDKGPCTPDAAEVKNIMPDAMTKDCSKCTPMQKKVFEKLILHYNEKQPEIFKEISAKYDAKGHFKSQIGSLKKAAAKQ